MIYLDAASTVPTAQAVQDRIASVLATNFGNVSGAHKISLQAKNLLEESREKIANLLLCSPDSIIFTSGATEAANIALQGYLRKNETARLFVSAIEHPAISKTAQFLKERNIDVRTIGVDNGSVFDLEFLDDLNQGDLVAIMPVNNEIGVINDVIEISKKIHKKGAKVLLDCVQSFYAFVPSDLIAACDFAIFSGHKIGAPQGVGLLYAADRKSLDPLTFGGSQEWEIRPGTTPAFLVDAFAFTFSEVISKRETIIEHIEKCNKVAYEELSQIDRINIHAQKTARSPHIIATHFNGIEAQMLMAMVTAQDVCVSRGSACASGASTPSHVLLALGLDPNETTSTLRLSFHAGTTIEEVRQGIGIIGDCVKQLRAEAG